MLPPPFMTFNPFVAPNPNQDHLQNLGWGVWPNQEAQEPLENVQQQLQHVQDDEPVPQLIPIQPEVAEEVVINVDGQGNILQDQQDIQENEAEVIAMDDLTDASDNEPEPPHAH